MRGVGKKRYTLSCVRLAWTVIAGSIVGTPTITALARFGDFVFSVRAVITRSIIG